MSSKNDPPNPSNEDPPKATGGSDRHDDGAAAARPRTLMDFLDHLPRRHGVPPTQPVSDDPDLRHRRHIPLPDDLPSGRIDRHPGLWRFFHSIFPETVTVLEMPSSYTFVVRTMPTGPWPLTVGRHPICITDEISGRGSLFPFRFPPGNTKVKLRDDLDGRANALSGSVLKTLCVDVVAYFADNIRDAVQIVEIMHTSEHKIFIILQDNVDVYTIREHHPKLPGRIANCLVVYLNEKHLNRPHTPTEFKARRSIVPQPKLGVADTSPSETLRPGVMLHSRSHSRTLTTTSEVLVKNRADDIFMTCAAHAIGTEETVLQRTASGPERQVGHAVQEIPFTDIATWQLEAGVDAVNETLEDAKGNVQRFSRLLGQVPGEDISFESLAFMNSAVTGALDGVVVAKSMRLESPSPDDHPTERDLRYIPYHWFYTGQPEAGSAAAEEFPEGTCGSAVWDHESRVLGFFRYQIAEGPFANMAVSVSAECLVEAGYTLA